MSGNENKQAHLGGGKEKEAAGTLVSRPRFYLFHNLETQGANLTYAWKEQLYTYEAGQIYEMTPDQAEHLNSLSVNKYITEQLPNGQLRTKVVSRQKRFSVTEVTAAEVERLRDEMAANM